MGLKILLVITAIVAFVFGIAFIFVPSQVYSQYGIESNLNLNYMGQIFGAALVGLAIIAWLVRNTTDPVARRAVVVAFFLSEAVGFIVSLIAQIRGAMNALGWSVVAIYLLLALGFASFTFKKSSS
jgi:uncharacterized membrane protein